MTTPTDISRVNTTISSGSSLDATTAQNGPASIDPEASCGSSSSTTKKKNDKKQQFTIKQRIDMYAFCVLEMEINGDKVSIKKQQNAVQKVIKNKLKQHLSDLEVQAPMHRNIAADTNHHQQSQQQTSISNHTETRQRRENAPMNASVNGCADNVPRSNDQNYYGSNSQGNSVVLYQQHSDQARDREDPSKTLLEMKVELEYRNYSDFQKVLPLTTQMLRGVQHRFAKYYPDCQPPSRTTIKHVFEKCVKHGTVENIKTRRKATKIPQGDEIANLLVSEPQLSLRQMARRLNVSTGTVSRRCKALGLIPDSVTTKHHQLATAKRQKQMKMIEGEQKPNTTNGPGPSCSSRAKNS